MLLFGFGSVYLLLRAFTKDEFGIWALFLTITAFIEVARNGLIQNALVKYLSACEKSEYATISTASLIINVLLTGISILFLLSMGGLLSSWLNAPELQQMLYIYVLTTAALIPFSQFNFLQQANFDFSGIFWSNFVRQGLLFLYILIGYFSVHHITLINLVWVQVAAAIAGALVSLWFARRYIQMDWNINWQWVSKLFHFGKFVFGTNLSSMLYKSIDKLMLGSLLGTVSVAVYDLAIRINNLLEVPTASVAAIVFPQSAKQMKTKGKAAVRLLYEKSVGAILAILVPGILFVLVFPEFIITVIAGEKYLDTVPILRMTVLYALFVPFARQFGTVFDSIGKPKTNFKLVVFGAVLNVFTNALFILQFGLMGAVYGTLTTYSITFIINQYLLYKVLNVKTLNTFFYAWEFYVEGANWLNNQWKKRLKPGNVG